MRYNLNCPFFICVHLFLTLGVKTQSKFFFNTILVSAGYDNKNPAFNNM